MAAHNELGRQAEAQAAAHLEAAGWQILHRNWRWQRRDLDLVARREDIVAFVEVRARTSTRCGHPSETIGWRKRLGLARAAQAWVQEYGVHRDVYRFDVVTVTPHGLEHVEGAWTL